MRLLVEYTSHGRGPAAPRTYTTTLDIVDDVAEQLLKAKTPYTFRERKHCTREALILAFLIYDIENLQERSFGDNDQILSIRRDGRN